RDQLRSRILRIALAHLLYELLVLRVSGTVRRGHFRDGGLNILERSSQIAQLHVVDRALDGAAIRMTQDDDELRSGHLGRVFEAPEDVGIDEVAGNAHGKYVAKR